MRKIKRSKKWITFFLAVILVIVILCIYGILAGKKEKRILSYVESVMPQYLSSAELYAGEYMVSEPITLYNWETGEGEKTLFFVFEGNEVVGHLVVQCYEGEYYSSFTESYADVLTKVYQQKTPVAFGFYDGCFVMCTETEEVILSAIINNSDPLKGFADNQQMRTLILNSLEQITVDDSVKIYPVYQ